MSRSKIILEEKGRLTSKDKYLFGNFSQCFESIKGYSQIECFILRSSDQRCSMKKGIFRNFS